MSFPKKLEQRQALAEQGKMEVEVKEVDEVLKWEHKKEDKEEDAPNEGHQHWLAKREVFIYYWRCFWYPKCVILNYI